MVFKWLENHKDELLENWELAHSGVQLRKILPLV